MGDALAKNHLRDFWKEVKRVNSTKYRGRTAPVMVYRGTLTLLSYGQQNLRNFIIVAIQAQEAPWKSN